MSGLSGTVVQQFNTLIHIFLQGLEANFDLGLLKVIGPLHPDHNIAENSYFMPDNSSKNKIFHLFRRTGKLPVIIAFEKNKQIANKSELIDLIFNLKVEEFHGFSHSDRITGFGDIQIEHQLLYINFLLIEVVEQILGQFASGPRHLSRFFILFGCEDGLEEIIKNQKQNRLPRFFNSNQYIFEQFIKIFFISLFINIELYNSDQIEGKTKVEDTILFVDEIVVFEEG